MRQPTVLVLLICLVFLSIPDLAMAAGKTFPYPYTQQDLPNGLRVITVPTDFPNLVSIYIVVAAGSRNEVEPGKSGFAHLFEHLMFRGTPEYPPEKYNQQILAAGAASNAFTTDDYTCYHTTFSKEDLPRMLSMEADRFQHLSYPEANFKTETLAVLGEYNKNSASPVQKLFERTDETAFTTHTYRHTTMGFLQDIQAMPGEYEYSRQFFERYYRPEYTTIIVAGDADPKRVWSLVNESWGAWKRGNYRPQIPAEPAQTAPKTAHIDWPSPTLPWVSVSYHAPAYTDSAEDSAALDAIASLGFDKNAPLYQKLVVEEQTADGLFTNVPFHVDANLFTILARVKKADDLASIQQQIIETVEQFAAKPVDAAKLEALKQHLRYEFVLSLNSSEAVAQTVASFVALRRTPETIDAIYDRYAQLTPADIQRAAQKYLTSRNRTVVTLTSAGGTK